MMRYLLLAAFTCLLPVAASAQQRMEFRGGNWFDGRQFAARTMYVVDGVLQAARPAAVDTVVDLQGGYVVPAFGEAHNHNVEGSSRTDATLARYLAEGIFYVLNPNSLPRSRAALGDKINVPGTLQVIFANGGLNVTGGHPWDLVQRNLARGTWKPEDAEGAFYHTIDTPADLDKKWPAILAGKPDIIKIYLLFSNEHEQRRNADHKGFIGLDPKLVPLIVNRAHAAGLRVMAHIENAEDFRIAVATGVDILAHMPGYGWLGAGDSAQFMLTRDDAQAAARRGTAVVTTLGFGRRANAEGRAVGELRRDALAAHNLRVLKDAGVTLAVGSDNYGATARSEALYLSDLGVFTNAELLRMWSESTPRLIFPQRKIGMLRDGYEANFIVLDGDPVADFTNVIRVRNRVLNGRLLP